jgi:hypothetical protein
MGYKEDVEIDINNLDAELLRQASRFQYWGRQEAKALYEKDQVEETLSKCKARIELAIRKDPEKYGYMNKLTEGAVSCLLVGQQEVMEATEASLKSRYKARILGIAVKSFEHKKKALEKLVELYISGYWATPKVDPEAQRAFDDQAQKIVIKSMKGDERMMRLAKKKEDERISEATAKSGGVERTVAEDGGKGKAESASAKDDGKDKAGEKPKRKTKAEKEIEAEAAAINKRRKAAGTKPKAIRVKTKGKGKDDPKPIGRTRAELSKQRGVAPKKKK